jgi:hypothetical protein
VTTGARKSDRAYSVVWDGTRDAVSSRADQRPATGTPAYSRDREFSLTRPERIIRYLQRCGTPKTTAEIVEAFDMRDSRCAFELLDHLARRGRIQHVGLATWTCPRA